MSFISVSDPDPRCPRRHRNLVDTASAICAVGPDSGTQYWLYAPVLINAWILYHAAVRTGTAAKLCSRPKSVAAKILGENRTRDENSLATA